MKKLLALTRIYHLAGDRSTEEDMAAVLSLAGCAYRLYRTASRKRWKRQGGIVIKVDVKTGQLKKYGIMQYPQGRIFMEHPLTKTKLSDFQIPFWQEVRETAEKAQRVFHQVKSVGWDIAITPKWPVIIEGNQDWGTNGIQAANGGLLTTRNKALFAQFGIKFYE